MRLQTKTKGEDTMSLQENIRYYREENGYFQKDLAALIFVSERTIGHYETGVRIPPIDKLSLIADALDVDVNDLLYPNRKTEEDWWEYYFEEGRGTTRNMDERRFKLIMKRVFPESNTLTETEDTITIHDYTFSRSLAQTLLPLCDERVNLYKICYIAKKDSRRGGIWSVCGHIDGEYVHIELRKSLSKYYHMNIYGIDHLEEENKITSFIVSKTKELTKKVQEWFLEQYPNDKLEYSLDAIIFLSNNPYEELFNSRAFYPYIGTKTFPIIRQYKKIRTIGDILHISNEEFSKMDGISELNVKALKNIKEYIHNIIHAGNNID